MIGGVLRRAALAALLLALLAAGLPAYARVEPDTTGLTAWLRKAAPQDTTTVLVTLRDDSAQAQVDQAQALADRSERRAQVHALLSERASRNEAALRAFLGRQGGMRGVRAIESFKSYSGLAITADRATIARLKGWDQVETIELDAEVRLDRLTANAPIQIAATEWNISHIGADAAYTTFGINGSGALLGILGTGARYTHQALRYNYKCYGLASHSACWYDAVAGQAAPYDDNGQGTHTLGTAVGLGGIGVAPGAKWIACKAFTGTGTATNSVILRCIDWFLAPGGSTANAPDVVLNPWGGSAGTTIFQAPLTNWVNAGILPVFPVGGGGGCGTVGAPGNYTNVIGVGATTATDTVTAFSSRGPSPTGAIKPDLMAPGQNIRSSTATNDTSYAIYSGSSMASAHVAGLAALLIDANPALTVAQLTSLMKNNALAIPATGCSSSGVPNNTYGWGRIRALETVDAVLP